MSGRRSRSKDSASAAAGDRRIVMWTAHGIAWGARMARKRPLRLAALLALVWPMPGHGVSAGG